MADLVVGVGNPILILQTIHSKVYLDLAYSYLLHNNQQLTYCKGENHKEERGRQSLCRF